MENLDKKNVKSKTNVNSTGSLDNTSSKKMLNRTDNSLDDMKQILNEVKLIFRTNFF